MKVSTKNVEVSKRRQSVMYVEILTLDNYKIKLTIKTDAIRAQSYANAEIFNELQWNSLCSVDHPNMKTEERLVYKSFEPTAKHFQEDRDELIRLSKIILS